MSTSASKSNVSALVIDDNEIASQIVIDSVGPHAIEAIDRPLAADATNTVAV